MCSNMDLGYIKVALSPMAGIYNHRNVTFAGAESTNADICVKRPPGLERERYLR